METPSILQSISHVPAHHKLSSYSLFCTPPVCFGSSLKTQTLLDRGGYVYKISRGDLLPCLHLMEIKNPLLCLPSRQQPCPFPRHIHTGRFGLPLPCKALVLSPWTQLHPPPLLLGAQLQSRDLLLPLLHKRTEWGGWLLFTINSGDQALAHSKFGASMATHVSKLAINHSFLKQALFQGIQSSWHWGSVYMAFSKCAHA